MIPAKVNSVYQANFSNPDLFTFDLIVCVAIKINDFTAFSYVNE